MIVIITIAIVKTLIAIRYFSLFVIFYPLEFAIFSSKSISKSNYLSLVILKGNYGSIFPLVTLPCSQTY